MTTDLGKFPKVTHQTYLYVHFLSALRGYLGLLIFLLLVGWSTNAYAHRSNESYVYFDVTEDSLGGRVEITLGDLSRIQQNSVSVENKLSKSQLLEQKEYFTDYFHERLKLSQNGEPYLLAFEEITFFGTKGRIYAQFHFEVLGIEKTPVTIDVSYRGLFADVDPAHRGFALIGSNARNDMDENEAYISLVFAPGDGVKKLYLNDEPTKDIARTFFEFGVWQFWLGSGQVLFLVSLLLSAVMRSENGLWVPSKTVGGSLRETARLVTTFTLAHTLTLWAATFGMIALPKSLVDALIVISVVVVALGNLFPRYRAGSWPVIFLFGIFHGFGFANAVDTLGLDPARMALGLGSYNLGIEIGQLAVLLVTFPLLFVLRNLTSYRVVGVQAGSIALILFALFWLYERTAGPFAAFAVVNAGGSY